MSGVHGLNGRLLLGNQAKISFGTTLSGNKALRFSQLAAGEHRVGYGESSVALTLKRPLLVAQTVLRQDQYFDLLRILGPRHRVLMAMFRGGWQTIVARGTDAALDTLTLPQVRTILEETVSVGRILRSGQRVFGFGDLEDVLFTRVSLRPIGIGGLFGTKDLGEHFPAYLNWLQAAALAALSEKGYRLPRGWEWEIAAGDLNEKSFRDLQKLREVAVLESDRPTEVGTKAPNSHGLYDMLGLVHEWTSDLHDPALSMDDSRTSMQVYGGAYYDSVENAFAANRTFFPPTTLFNGLGVRLFADVNP